VVAVSLKKKADIARSWPQKSGLSTDA